MGVQVFEGIQFSHAFQPIIDIEKKAIVSYEVLLRGPKGEPPFFVFDQIKNDDLICFDEFNREHALTFVARQGIECSLNLNYTPSAMLQDDGYSVIETINKAKELGLSPRQLVVEIVESERIEDYKELAGILNKLRKEQVVIALDDFGAGYAGLNMLADVQPDLIKIDMALIRNIHENGPRQSIVRAIHNVCEDLAIDVLAEGVETQEEFGWLRKNKITLYQGYLFAKPAFERFEGLDELLFDPF